MPVGLARVISFHWFNHRNGSPRPSLCFFSSILFISCLPTAVFSITSIFTRPVPVPVPSFVHCPSSRYTASYLPHPSFSSLLPCFLCAAIHTCIRHSQSGRYHVAWWQGRPRQGRQVQASARVCLEACGTILSCRRRDDPSTIL